VRRVVLDSNVLVAGFRSRRGASFRLLELLRLERFEIAMSVPLALEYEAVLVRHAKALALRREDAEGLVDYLCQVAHRQEIHFLWRPALIDPRDEFLLELAIAAECDAIVTHNVRDFAGAANFPIRVLAPSEFLAQLEDRS
jgi:putative PIN family toxin of toxin-antitoxin system